MSQTRTITVTTAALKPRNPFAVPASRRAAGAHGGGHKAQRQRASRALRHELEHWRNSP